MTAQTTPTDTWLSQFIARKRNAPWPDAPWIDLLRQAAFGRFCALGFPTARNEDWRYTDVEPIAATLFEPAPVTTADADTLAPFTRGTRLVFVNGRLQRPVPTLPRGVTAGLLSGQKLKNGSELTSNAWEHLAKCASFRSERVCRIKYGLLGRSGVHLRRARGGCRRADPSRPHHDSGQRADRLTPAHLDRRWRVRPLYVRRNIPWNR